MHKGIFQKIEVDVKEGEHEYLYFKFEIQDYGSDSEEGGNNA